MPEIRKVTLVTSPYAQPQFVEHVKAALQQCSIDVVPSTDSVDLVLSIGGDGTFLSAAPLVMKKETPILGINTGHLGFLADVAPEAVDESIAKLKSGHYTIEQRTLIEVSTVGDAFTSNPIALNEVAVLKQDNSALIQIETYIGDQLLGSYRADGLIIATPTGSTGYSLSVGGPIIMPDSHALCLSAIAPHSLNVRPVIVRDDVEITLKMHSRSAHFLLAVDGRSQSLSASTALHIRKASHCINVMKICHPNHFDTLREKMNWGINTR